MDLIELAIAKRYKDNGGSGDNGDGSSYTLPIASANTLGGVKIGSGLTIDADGVLSGGSGSEGGSNDSLYIIDFLFDDDGENVYGTAYYNETAVTGNDISAVANQSKIPVMFDTFKNLYYYKGSVFEGGAYVQRFERIELTQNGGTITSIRGYRIDIPATSAYTGLYSVTKTFS